MVRLSKPRVILVCGSLNQTSQLHAVGAQLHEFACWYTPIYGGLGSELARRLGWLENTIGGNKLRARCIDYLTEQRLPLDLGARARPYDLVVTCTDLLRPANLKHVPTVVVQEGMTDPETPLSRAVQRSKVLPLWLCGTTLTGASRRYTAFCVASEGYRELFVRRGAAADRLHVTGIPNFDACARWLDNALPDRDYVLACTSDLRELWRRDDRAQFIERVRKAARGRAVHFKLHPNEDAARARREIESHCPGAIVHQDGDTNLLIANCSELFTQYSSVAFVGIALGKVVHSYFDSAELRALCPLQNGGRSAFNIAQICRDIVGVPRVDTDHALPSARAGACA
jgi:hypothetical protein